MKKQYLHLCVYPCTKCKGPVVAGSLVIRENEISGKSGVRNVGGVCLSCGNKEESAAAPVRKFLPVEWDLSFSGGVAG